MKTSEIRDRFLTFFASKGHKIVPSAPLVVKDDPTLMFTNAGMNQFKDYFLGTRQPEATRIADTQKCLRVSGKHNDLEEVGLDTYHHTMFEMLGNWSFGDYFKEEAIAWAWELLTGEYNLPADRLYATVFGGDEDDGLEADEEARQIWKKFLPSDRILDGSKKDNFWEMGDTGPCGPCSEIHIDLRSQEERERVSGTELVNRDHPLVVEIWNLVFIQFNRLADGGLQPLPQRHIDTGMGLERLAMAIQGKTSNYDTDVFQPLLERLGQLAGVRYGQDEKTDIAMRVVADHIRAIAFSIADGQLPSNTGAGYVIRRILRRAVRYGFQFLNLRQPFMAGLLPVLQKQFAGVFPELEAQAGFIAQAITREEESFLRTLENGLKRLHTVIEDLQRQGGKVIDGALAFELYDTYGFPYDLTSLIARERGLQVDQAGFDREMARQKERSRQDAAKETGDWVILDDSTEVRFVGYEQLAAEARILRYRKLKQKGREMIQVVLDITPFYAESGGQVGDTGYLEVNGERIRVLDTKKENELIVHFVDKLPADTAATLKAVVDAGRRLRTVNNHSATHLMHAALRQVLGTHVEQRGSLVNDRMLRFDFSHFDKLTDEQIRQVESLVNARIRENIPLREWRDLPLEEARKMGAMALFGEKYGEKVRVIAFDPKFSIELCGGTHVQATGQIGFFKITSESSIAAGIRRIEAVTGEAAEAYVWSQQQTLQELREAMKFPKDLVKAVSSLAAEKNKLEKELEKMKERQVAALMQELKDKARPVNGLQVIIEKVNVPDGGALKNLAFGLKNSVDNLFLTLAADINGKPQIAVAIADNLVSERELHAGNLVRQLAAHIKGGGGGQPFFATAGGKDPAGLDKALEEARQLFS